ncbi:hypothetical protein T484DRAFT_1854711 [Baffinella frigidus]|nr:hypothetical protein T484DRAFT_1854711 [Cryptophyta sp. CCMP2293]
MPFYYCSRACQKKDWKLYKVQCQYTEDMYDCCSNAAGSGFLPPPVAASCRRR